MSTNDSASASDPGEEEFDNEALLKATKRLHVLVVDDDAFTLKTLVGIVLKSAQEMMPHVTVDVETSETAAGALALCSDRREDVFDLVLLDYMLPGGCNADAVLPSLRTMCGGVPAVVMLSSEEMVTPLKKCLTLGADAFRLKPLNTTELNELVQYTLRKRQYVTERLSRSQSPLRSPNFRLLDEAEQVLAVGRRGRLRMGMYHRGGTPVVIKELLVARGPPPPPHPHLNKVYDRIIDQGTAFELRQLCDRGEFFDMLLEEHQGRFPNQGGFPPAAALRVFTQLVAAVDHCHGHGAVNGQLHPENVLLRSSASASHDSGHEAHEDNVTVQLTGFYGAPSGEEVALRPWTSCDAPELQGRSHAHAHELRASDVWSLGTLLLYLATGTLQRGLALAQLAAVDDSRTTTGEAAGVGVATEPGAAGAGAEGAGAAGAAEVASLSEEVPCNRKRALLRLAGEMLQQEPARRPTIAQLLASLSEVQRAH